VRETVVLQAVYHLLEQFGPLLGIGWARHFLTVPSGTRKVHQVVDVPIGTLISCCNGRQARRENGVGL
jgi:hypothetical protein